MKNHLQHYYENGFPHVQGWCLEDLFKTINLLDESDINKKGGVLEIGVHHGKFFILLNQIVTSEFNSYAVDVFDNQELNIDKSGLGSLEIFKSNLENYDRHNGKNTKIIKGDSTDPSLDLKKLIGLGSLRFISIDGGHTVEHTVADLILSNELINNQGVVILDDILNYHWLGVIEGVGRFLDKRPTLVPFAIGHNKLYLAKLTYRDFYFNLFAKSGLGTKIVPFYGCNIVAL
jgi:hypothetical protein